MLPGFKMNSRNFNNQSSLEVEFPAGKAYLASSIGNLAIKNGLYKCPFGGAPAGCGRVSQVAKLVDHVARHIVLETIRGKYHLLHPNTCGFCGDDGCHTTAKAKQRKKNAPLWSISNCSRSPSTRMNCSYDAAKIKSFIQRPSIMLCPSCHLLGDADSNVFVWKYMMQRHYDVKHQCHLISGYPTQRYRNLSRLPTSRNY